MSKILLVTKDFYLKVSIESATAGLTHQIVYARTMDELASIDPAGVELIIADIAMGVSEHSLEYNLTNPGSVGGEVGSSSVRHDAFRALIENQDWRQRFDPQLPVLYLGIDVSIEAVSLIRGKLGKSDSYLTLGLEAEKVSPTIRRYLSAPS